jgi:hypothetical protein
VPERPPGGDARTPDGFTHGPPPSAPARLGDARGRLDAVPVTGQDGPISTPMNAAGHDVTALLHAKTAGDTGPAIS